MIVKESALKVELCIILLLFFLLNPFSRIAFGEEPGRKDVVALYRKLVEVLKDEQSANKKWIDWQKEKAQINQEILKLKLKAQYLRFRQKQLDEYIATVKKRIQDLEEKKAESEKFKVELEPYLYEVVAKLKDFIHSDLPFFQNEREDRISFLEDTLADYELSVSEKLRRVLQAIIVEAQYGRTCDVTDELITLSNGEEPVYVRQVRIGRVGLFYITPDSKNCGFYDLNSRAWKHVPDYTKRNVLMAADIIEGKKRAKWIDLPLQGRKQ